MKKEETMKRSKDNTIYVRVKLHRRRHAGRIVYYNHIQSPAFKTSLLISVEAVSLGGRFLFAFTDFISRNEISFLAHSRYSATLVRRME